MRFRATITIQGPCFKRYNAHCDEVSGGIRLPLVEWEDVLAELPEFEGIEVTGKALLAHGPVPKGSREWRTL